MIKLDFYAGTHGHFLEYVANIYIMQTTPSASDIFKPPAYSAHGSDDTYLANRKIFCSHFSDYKRKFENDDIVIRIDIDTNDDKMFYVALTNLQYKSGDLGLDWQLTTIPEDIRNDPAAHRNIWYSKISERDIYSNYYSSFIPITNDIFYFDFKSFFSFSDFCVELTKLSNFLNQTFFPDDSLYNLWATFIKVNQGWNSYNKCEQILENIFLNAPMEIDCSIIEQGWINHRLSKMCNLYSGLIFTEPTYPANTQIIYNIIQEHLNKSR